MRSEFERIAFADPEKAGASLDALLAGRGPALAAHLAQALGECAEPDVALVRLERLLEASFNAGGQLELMEATFRYAKLVLTLLDQSHFLTDIVCRNPEYLSWLWEEATLDSAKPREEAVEEVLGQMGAFSAFEARCKALRRLKRREILRIATRDVFVHAPLPSITEDLSNFADAALEGALVAAREDMAARFGAPVTAEGAEATFVVLAFGKLGGRELNFSSDIDLMFLYSAEGETQGGERSVSTAEYFQKLGERIIKAVSEATADGHVFRVDMRLRPHGRVGPLAISLEDAMYYYERVGRAWERQALLKVRPAAGDKALGARFAELTRPFVFPRYFDDETLDDIRQVKRQLEQEIQSRRETEIEVKLGRGGIRDIEFTVQMLQLLNGGRFMDVRTPNTLEAIDALCRRGQLRPLEAPALARHYVFLRQVEHRLQLEGSQQRHALPREEAELAVFARRLGYPSGASFMAEYREKTAEVRAILDRFFAEEGGGHLWIHELLDPRVESPASLARLEAGGFRDPGKAREWLLTLAVGPSEQPHRSHVRQAFGAVAPAVIEAVCACGDPDGALFRLCEVLSNLKAPGSVYEILKAHPDLARCLVALVNNSAYLSGFLARDPGLFELFGQRHALEKAATRVELERVLTELSEAYDREAALYRFRDGETFRIGVRDLVGGIAVEEIGRELTLLAEVGLAHVVDRALATAAERYGASEARFAVLGLGKLGGCELGYGSDLDLVFVYESGRSCGEGVEPEERFAAVAAQVIRTLKEATRYGALYDVDARLRPDGNKGMLTIDPGRLHDYYAHEAQAWERLALVKARAVAGDAAFAAEVEAQARALTFERALTAEDVEQIESTRKKLASQADPLDLKKAEGGLAELEFAVRLMQLRHGLAHPEVRRGDVLGALAALRDAKLIDAAEADALREAYLTIRRIENRIRVGSGRSGSLLPPSAEARGDLARRLGLSEDLDELVQRHRARVHEIYTALIHEFA